MANIHTPNLLEVAAAAWNSQQRIQVFSSTGKFLVEGIPLGDRYVPTVALHYEDDNDFVLEFKDNRWRDSELLPN